MCAYSPSYGGAPKINRVDVSFGMSGEELDPEEVTRLLATQPNHANRRGDRIPTTSDRAAHYYATGVWLIESRLSGVTDVDSHIADLLAMIPRLDAVVPELLNAGLRCAIRAEVFFSGYCVGFTVSQKVIRWLAEMCLELDILADPEPDEDDEDDEEDAGNCQSCA